jgi:hypothetical protein
MWIGKLWLGKAESNDVHIIDANANRILKLLQFVVVSWR